MTTKTNGFRGFAIAALLTAGVVTTIASGGGGGSDGTIGPPAGGGGPTLALTAANAPAVTSTMISAVGMAFDLSDITSVGLPIQAVMLAPGVAAPKDGGFQIELPVAEAPDISSCFNGGTVDMTITQADPNTLTVGDRIIAVFDNCDDNDGYVISGTVDLTVSSYQGDILAYDYLLGLDVTLVDVVIEDGVETVTANASFMLTMDSLDNAGSRLSLAGSQLQISFEGEVVTLTDFDHESTVRWFDAFVPQTSTQASGTLEIQSFGGTIDYATPVAILTDGWDNDPHSGEILITGANSSIRIVIFTNSDVTLEIDVNGDGVIDEYVYANWSELSGDM